MKKFSLIVALMLALTVIFISCGADPLPPPPPDDSETFTDIDLVDEDGKLAYNYFAGQPENQKGWATDGQSEIDSKVGKLGFKTEDFQAAKFLTLEIDKDNFKGDFGIGYGVEPSAAGSALGLSNAGWMTKTIVSQGNVTAAAANGVTLTGSELKIELAKALPRYDAFIDSSVKEVKLFLLYYEGVDKLVKGAKLQISSLPPEFFPATKIEVKPITGKIARTNIKLEATITPKAGNTTTSVQLVTWEIVGGLPAPIDVDFAYPSPAGVDSVKLTDTIFVNKTDGGKVKVRATLKKGGLNADGDKVDVVSDVYTIVVGSNPYPGSALAESNETTWGANVNDFWKKDDATTYPKYIVIVSYLGSSNDFTSSTFDISLNAGNGTQQAKGDGKVIPTDSTGLAYFVIDISELPNYNTLMSDYGWGVQVCNWGGGFGGTLKIFVMNSSVTDLTKPAGAVDFDYDGTSAGVHPTIPGYYATSLPVELDWE